MEPKIKPDSLLKKNKPKKGRKYKVILLLFLSIVTTLVLFNRNSIIEKIDKIKHRKTLLKEANLSLRNKNYGLAIEKFKLVLELDPDKAKIYEAIAYSYFQKEQYDLAIEFYEKSIKISNNPDYYLNLGTSYAAKGNFKKAITYLKKSLDINPDSELGYINLGRCHNGLGEDDQAIKAFAKAYEINPKNYSALNGLTISYYNLEDFDKLIELSKKQMYLDPKNINGYLNSGLVYLKKNMFIQALSLFEACLEIEPNCAEAHYFLSLTYLKMGNSQLAKKHYQMLRKLKRDDLAYLIRVLVKKNSNEVGD